MGGGGTGNSAPGGGKSRETGEGLKRFYMRTAIIIKSSVSACCLLGYPCERSFFDHSIPG